MATPEFLLPDNGQRFRVNRDSGEDTHETDLRINHRSEDGTNSERYGLVDIAQIDGPERFLSRTGSQR